MKYIDRDNRPEHATWRAVLTNGQSFEPNFGFARIFRIEFSGILNLYLPKNAKREVYGRLDLVGKAADGSISASTLGAGGAGYVVGDTFTVTGGSILATGEVTSVNAGVVTGYSITGVGAGYSVANGVATVATSGAGTGLTINITVIGNQVVLTTKDAGGGAYSGWAGNITETSNKIAVPFLFVHSLEGYAGYLDAYTEKNPEYPTFTVSSEVIYSIGM